jgi:hypothetical protein
LAKIRPGDNDPPAGVKHPADRFAACDYYADAGRFLAPEPISPVKVY